MNGYSKSYSDMLCYIDCKICKLCPYIRLKLLGIKSATTHIYIVRCSEASCNYESNQQYATIQVNLLFLVNSTCFGRCFRPSSGAFDCIYSIW